MKRIGRPYIAPSPIADDVNINELFDAVWTICEALNANADEGAKIGERVESMDGWQREWNARATERIEMLESDALSQYETDPPKWTPPGGKPYATPSGSDEPKEYPQADENQSGAQELKPTIEQQTDDIIAELRAEVAELHKKLTEANQRHIEFGADKGEEIAALKAENERLQNQYTTAVKTIQHVEAILAAADRKIEHLKGEVAWRDKSWRQWRGNAYIAIGERDAANAKIEQYEKMAQRLQAWRAERGEGDYAKDRIGAILAVLDEVKDE